MLARLVAMMPAVAVMPIVAAALCGPCTAGAVEAARVIRVGPQGEVATIAAAALRARDGDTVEVQSGEYRGDVAVWLQKRLVIRSVGGPARLIADGQSAEGKAIWVIRDGNFEVQGFEFVGARVADRNGAGIRFERGRLVVRDSKFIDNQMGLLTGNDESTELVVERCEFSGPIDGSHWYHNLYVGRIARLSVTGSWSHDARSGHLIKSRARENDILYNRLVDEQGSASYELEFPDGGIARVVGNQIGQSASSENPVIVSFGAEGYHWEQNLLSFAHNTVVNEAARPAAFVRVSWGSASAVLANNLWVGPGVIDVPSTASRTGNRHLGLDALKAPARHDYRIDRARVGPVDAPAQDDARPVAQYVHERKLELLRGTELYPGAVQQ